ncbi:FecR domain-containing protein, partial [Bacteroides thetaiotaomicron]|uniref:FecR domain-containing protein n=1 Tax=Bacteroides thetaiotaomicron TaxID=818 RepID=UPI00210D5953
QKDFVECFKPTAEIRELTLPDGTPVMLISRSTLLYPQQFAGKTRSEYLIGEANLQVKPDEKQPFIVKANDFKITALG